MPTPSRSAVATWAAKQLAGLPLPMAPRRPVFIIGCARSGTSVLKRVLGRHPEIDGYPSEANELWHPSSYPWAAGARRAAPLWRDPKGFTRDSLAHWPASHGARIRRVFALHQRLCARPVFLNKSSMLNFMLPEVNRLFPDARFIHIVRDGRAVALSYALKEHRKMLQDEALYRSSGLWMSFEDLCERMAGLWVETLTEIETQRRALGWDGSGRYHECRYEDFCATPLESTREIVTYLGLDPGAAKLGEHVKSMNYKFREQLAAPLLAAITSVMAGMLEAKGYPKGAP